MKATFPNADHALWPGLFVNTRLLLSTPNGVVVPASAVQRGPTGLYAYVVKDDVATIQPIAVAKTQDGLALIATGLADGDRVVTDGQYKLRAGAHVVEQQAAKTAAAQP
jgi:multidrug efflux system membrane fusion protein